MKTLRGEGVAAVRSLRERVSGELIARGSPTLSVALFRAAAFEAGLAVLDHDVDPPAP